MSHSLAAHGSDAHAEAGKNGATAHNAHHDPGDQVVGSHELTRLLLDESGLKEEVFGILEVTRGVSSNSVESPDNTSNVPGESTAALTATGKTEAAGSKAWAQKSGETTEEESSGQDDLADEAPKEPRNESVVNANGSLSGSFNGDCEPVIRHLCVESIRSFSDPDIFGIGITESKFAEISHEGDPSTAHGKSTDAGAYLGTAASSFEPFNLSESVVHRTFVLNFLFIYNCYGGNFPTHSNFIKS